MSLNIFQVPVYTLTDFFILEACQTFYQIFILKAGKHVIKKEYCRSLMTT